MFRTISLIHPSRSRAEIASRQSRSWLLAAGEPIDYILSIDTDDPQLAQYDGYFQSRRFICNGNRSAIDAINNAAKQATGDIIVVMSDDFDCPPQWATALLRLTEGKTDWIAKTPDGIQNWIITLPIMDRAYYNRFGYVYYPEYKHMFCLHPDTPVFMGDYSFKRIGDIQVGDDVIGTERKKGKNAKTQERDFLARTKVTQTHKRIADLFEITLESGKKLICTDDHRWGYYNGSKELKYGPPKIGRRLKKILDMPGNPPDGLDFERGWLAGMWDGEGSFDVITQSVVHNELVCHRIEELLNKIGFKFSITHYSSKTWKNSTQRVFTLNGGRNEYIKMLNWLNPVKRITKRTDKRMLSARYGSPDTIIDIKKIGPGEVVCITTGASNFIADGYLSHNCDTEMTCVGDLLQRTIKLDIPFQHNHYSVGKSKKDSISDRADATWGQGEALFIERARKNFDLIDPPGRITDEAYNNWIRRKL